MKAVNQLWAVLFFFIYVVFMFFVVLNIFIAILNDAYTVIKTSAVWEQLDQRKPLSLREKFEVRSARCLTPCPAPNSALVLTLAPPPTCLASILLLRSTNPYRCARRCGASARTSHTSRR